MLTEIPFGYMATGRAMESSGKTSTIPGNRKNLLAYPEFHRPLRMPHHVSHIFNWRQATSEPEFRGRTPLSSKTQNPPGCHRSPRARWSFTKNYSLIHIAAYARVATWGIRAEKGFSCFRLFSICSLPSALPCRELELGEVPYGSDRRARCF